MTSNTSADSADSPGRQGIRRWVVRLSTGAALTVGVLGLLPISSALADSHRAAPPARPATAAERAIADLVGDRPLDAMRDLPADFSRRLGYRPVVIDGRPLNPAGDCSSPVPLPDRFTDACRAHDLGYDLLRYSDSTGRPAGAWARTALDGRLIDDMHAVCDDPLCHAAAETARTGLAVNTWRQHSGPPVRESGSTIVVGYLSRTAETVGLR